MGEYAIDVEEGEDPMAYVCRVLLSFVQHVNAAVLKAEGKPLDATKLSLLEGLPQQNHLCREVFGEYSDALERIFTYYAMLEQPCLDAPGSRKGWPKIKAATEKMSFHEYFLLCTDFNVTPLLSKQLIGAVFRRAIEGSPSGEGDDGMMYEEFLDCLVFSAVLAFVPSSEAGVGGDRGSLPEHVVCKASLQLLCRMGDSKAQLRIQRATNTTRKLLLPESCSMQIGAGHASESQQSLILSLVLGDGTKVRMSPALLGSLRLSTSTQTAIANAFDTLSEYDECGRRLVGSQRWVRAVKACGWVPGRLAVNDADIIFQWTRQLERNGGQFYSAPGLGLPQFLHACAAVAVISLIKRQAETEDPEIILAELEAVGKEVESTLANEDDGRRTARKKLLSYLTSPVSRYMGAKLFDHFKPSLRTVFLNYCIKGTASEGSSRFMSVRREDAKAQLRSNALSLAGFTKLCADFGIASTLSFAEVGQVFRGVLGEGSSAKSDGPSGASLNYEDFVWSLAVCACLSAISKTGDFERTRLTTAEVDQYVVNLLQMMHSSSALERVQRETGAVHCLVLYDPVITAEVLSSHGQNMDSVLCRRPSALNILNVVSADDAVRLRTMFDAACEFDTDGTPRVSSHVFLKLVADASILDFHDLPERYNSLLSRIESISEEQDCSSSGFTLVDLYVAVGVVADEAFPDKALQDRVHEVIAALHTSAVMPHAAHKQTFLELMSQVKCLVGLGPKVLQAASGSLRTLFDYCAAQKTDIGADRAMSMAEFEAFCEEFDVVSSGVTSESIVAIVERVTGVSPDSPGLNSTMLTFDTFLDALLAISVFIYFARDPVVVSPSVATSARSTPAPVAQSASHSSMDSALSRQAVVLETAGGVRLRLEDVDWCVERLLRRMDLSGGPQRVSDDLRLIRPISVSPRLAAPCGSRAASPLLRAACADNVRYSSSCKQSCIQMLRLELTTPPNPEIFIPVSNGELVGISDNEHEWLHEAFSTLSTCVCDGSLVITLTTWKRLGITRGWISILQDTDLDLLFTMILATSAPENGTQGLTMDQFGICVGGIAMALAVIAGESSTSLDVTTAPTYVGKELAAVLEVVRSQDRPRWVDACRILLKSGVVADAPIPTDILSSHESYLYPIFMHYAGVEIRGQRALVADKLRELASDCDILALLPPGFDAVIFEETAKMDGAAVIDFATGYAGLTYPGLLRALALYAILGIVARDVETVVDENLVGAKFDETVAKACQVMLLRMELSKSYARILRVRGENAAALASDSFAGTWKPRTSAERMEEHLIPDVEGFQDPLLRASRLEETARGDPCQSEDHFSSPTSPAELRGKERVPAPTANSTRAAQTPEPSGQTPPPLKKKKSTVMKVLKKLSFRKKKVS
eukprot:Rmarinus@m.19370